MPGLPQQVLLSKLRAALPHRTRFENDDSTRPANLFIPRIGRARVYLWTVTTVESVDRAPDEYKIQLILPGQRPQERGELDLSDKPTFLLGYSPDYGVFVGWEARLHQEFGYSATVYIKEGTLDEARSTGWAVAPTRRVRAGPEVSIAFSPANLPRFLKTSMDADNAAKFGTERELLYLLETPNQPEFEVPVLDEDAAEVVAKMRGEELVRRKSRDSTFGSMVVKEYGFACAVCGIQLDIVEGAHIIPVKVPTSMDEKWNGVALCPNHHKLFDALRFTITPDLIIRVDNAIHDFFVESRRALGMEELLTVFHHRPLRRPNFFAHSPLLRQRMVDAFSWHANLTGQI
jgi:putative restriction endonuclease